MTAKARLVVSPSELEPKLRCKPFDHAWTKGAWILCDQADGAWLGRSAIGPYRHRCLRRERCGDRGRMTDRRGVGLLEPAPRRDCSGEFWPPIFSAASTCGAPYAGAPQPARQAGCSVLASSDALRSGSTFGVT